MRGHPEAAGDASGHGRAKVAQDAVEIETTEHEPKVTDRV
jgi:hypothetical protein